jgi:hypothetical protein
VALDGGAAPHKRGPKRGSPPPPVPDPALPSDRSRRRWRQELRNTGHLHDPLPKGHPPPILSDGEKRVIGGWVLSKFARHSLVCVENTRAFLLGAWQLTTSYGYVSELMYELHLPSKIVSEREIKYWNPNMVSEVFGFLRPIHELLDSGLNPSRLSAVDVCYWSNSGHIVRMYGPAGR